MRVLIFFVLFLACSSVDARDPGERSSRQQIIIPPQPEAATVTVRRGETISIPLVIRPMTERTIKPLLRSTPVHGKLNNFRKVGPTEWEISYRHDGGSADMDSFSFSAQSLNSSVSTAAVVTIQIEDPPGKLVAPGMLDFGPVWAGETNRRELLIENGGGEIITGDLFVSGGWSIPGELKYTIPPGGRQTIFVDLKMDGPGEVSGHIKYSGNPDQSTKMQALVLAPFLAMIKEPTDDTSSNTILKITNMKGASIPVDISGDGFGLPALLELVPYQLLEFDVVKPPATKIVRLASGSFSQSLEIPKQTMPPAQADSLPASGGGDLIADTNGHSRQSGKQEQTTREIPSARHHPSATGRARDSSVADTPTVTEPHAESSIHPSGSMRLLPQASVHFTIHDISSKSIEYSVAEDLDLPGDVVLQKKNMALLEGYKMAWQWVDFPDFKIVSAKGTQILRISQLDPSTYYEFRLNHPGIEALLLPSAFTAAPPPVPFRLYFLLVVLIGLALFGLKKMRRKNIF